MGREIKFRVFDGNVIHHIFVINSETGEVIYNGRIKNWPLMQYTGLKDKNGVEIYEGDILEFDNGDRFVIKCERWVEFYVDWIGDPECEDQARDFYRIERAKLIGNIYESPELLEINNG